MKRLAEFRGDDRRRWRQNRSEEPALREMVAVTEAVDWFGDEGPFAVEGDGFEDGTRRNAERIRAGFGEWGYQAVEQ